MSEKIPVVQGTPAFDALGGRLEEHSNLYIEQKFSWLEGLSQGICEIPNTYKIFGGTDNQAPMVLVAVETGGGCDRCCCAPGHSFVLEIATAENSSDVLVSLERPGCEACVCTSPKPCLCCFACTHSCTDQVIIHQGKIEGKAGKIETPKVIGMVRQPDGGGGGCTPTLELFPADGDYLSETPSAYVQGPCIFGGCSELCCESDFPVSRKPDKSGDLALIKHLTPKSCGQACAEACTDTDRFSISYAGGVSPEEKAQILAATLLTDYMFFEQDNGMCQFRDGKLYITCFECYCYGCICPCNIILGGNNEGGGGGN